MKDATLSGLVLGFAGAVLDFSSGYLILTQSITSTNVMGTTMVEDNTSTIILGIGILALGAILALTAIVSVLPIGIGRMRFFGALMIVYGLAMLFIGVSMYSRISPMMDGYLPSSFGMFAVGLLMIINGLFMNRNPKKM